MLRRLVITLLLAITSQPVLAELLPSPGNIKTPALSLPDLGGTQHTLSDYQGKVVLVNFWATWCAPCLLEMPDMQRLLAAMQGRPFAVLAVNVKEGKTRVWRFKNMLKVDFPALLDSDGSTSEAWDVDFYPTSYLIDSEGYVRYTAYGPIDWDSDESLQLIEQLMPDVNTALRQAFVRTGQP